MGRPLKDETVRQNTRDSEMRDEEILRANKELAAYFKGRRTEREARAALKIIKAFIRDREDTDPKHRRPLPGIEPAAAVRTRTRKKIPAKSLAPKRLSHQSGNNSQERMRSQKDQPVANDALSVT